MLNRFSFVWQCTVFLQSCSALSIKLLEAGCNGPRRGYRLPSSLVGAASLSGLVGALASMAWAGMLPSPRTGMVVSSGLAILGRETAGSM